MSERSNERWIADLKDPGPKREAALADLRERLVQGLGYALANRSDVDREILEDFAQEALLKILDGLDSFRGESRFTTWAQKIAVNVAFTELRRHRWRDVSLDEMIEETFSTPRVMIDPSVGPERRAVQQNLVETLSRLIEQELTEKQRRALVATRIHGVPLEEVARRMGSNRNALYKLIHDARQKLQRHLLAEGLSTEEVLEAFR